MKKMSILLLLVLFIQTTFAKPSETPANLPENLSVKIDFNYSHVDNNKITDQYNIKNNIQMTTNNHQWILIPNPQANETKDKYVLLSQIENANSDEITLHFLILDMNNKEPIVVSKPKLIIRYGQPAQIALENGKEKIKLNILAKA